MRVSDLCLHQTSIGSQSVLYKYRCNAKHYAALQKNIRALMPGRLKVRA